MEIRLPDGIGAKGRSEHQKASKKNQAEKGFGLALTLRVLNVRGCSEVGHMSQICRHKRSVFGVETLEMLLLLSSSRLYDTFGFIISTDELDWN